MRRIAKLRPWVQTAFLAVWLFPVTWFAKLSWIRGVPSCVFHCYACPLASMACPVGIVGQFLAAGLFPFLAIGVVLVTAALVGSLICGWACPFGYIQDLLAKIPLPKIPIPNFLGYGRYVVLVGAVVAVPLIWHDVKHALFICQICPAGALEGGVGQVINQGVRGAIAGGWSGGVEKTAWVLGLISVTKYVILGAFIVAAVAMYRPWCKIFCPLGGFLALFNRVSVFHLRYDAHHCRECNICRTHCSMGVAVEKAVNTPNCIRCMECTTCGAIHPDLAKWGSRGKALPSKQDPPDA